MEIKEVIMQRDGISEETADEMIDEAQSQINEILENEESPFMMLERVEGVVMALFGLEPDYVDEFIPC